MNELESWKKLLLHVHCKFTRCDLCPGNERCKQLGRPTASERSVPRIHCSTALDEREEGPKYIVKDVMYSCPECNIHLWPAGKKNLEEYRCLCPKGYWLWNEYNWLWFEEASHGRN